MKKKEKLVKNKPRRQSPVKLDRDIISKIERNIKLSNRPTPFPNPSGFGPAQGLGE